ncbi:MAG: glycosyltransferase family 9 protein [Planctomycetes bacterium]|nr:glycosyltransferase family 9 protein [Planctomycetota bacterium]
MNAPAEPLGTAPPPRDARILALRLSALGDVVFAMPAVLALRQLVPEGRVDWLTEDRHAELLRGFPGVDEVLSFPRRAWGRRGGARAMLRHLRALRGRRYDLVVDFQGNLKSALQLLTARAPRKLGFDRPAAREGAQRFLSERVADPGRVHRAERDLRLARRLGFTGDAPAPGPWPLPVPAAAPVAGDRRPRVLLHTSVTAYGRDKEWPRPRWVELARGLDGAGLRVELLWTGGQRAEVEDLAESTGCAFLAPATPGLHHLMALTDAADLLIGTDSGPLHLASLRGTPVVGLYGPTDPLRYAPPGPRQRVVSVLPEGEAPPVRDRSCRSPLMDALDAASVQRAALDLLHRE